MEPTACITDLPDYSGVPLGQLRAVIEKYRKGEPTKLITLRAGIDAREYARISRVAPDTAIIGLAKVDKITIALGQNLTDLVNRYELDVVPLGGGTAGYASARIMAKDELLSADICPTEPRVEAVAQRLLNTKQAIIRAYA